MNHISTNIIIDASFSATGALLDDLLVAEDPPAAETIAAASCDMQSGRAPGSYSSVDESRGRHEDGAVLLGNPVAPPVNGDIYADVSSENAVPQGSRLVTYIGMIFTFIKYIRALSLDSEVLDIFCSTGERARMLMF